MGPGASMQGKHRFSLIRRPGICFAETWETDRGCVAGSHGTLCIGLAAAVSAASGNQVLRPTKA